MLLVVLFNDVSGIGTAVVEDGNDGVGGGSFRCCSCDCCGVC